MNVTLPDSLRNWIETQVQVGGHASTNDYVEKVMRDERERVRREIDQQLVEGMESGEPIEVNEAFWVERRRVLEETLKELAKEKA